MEQCKFNDSNCEKSVSPEESVDQSAGKDKEKTGERLVLSVCLFRP